MRNTAAGSRPPERSADELVPARLRRDQPSPDRQHVDQRVQQGGRRDVDGQERRRERQVLDAGVPDRLGAERQQDDRADQHQVRHDHRDVDGRERGDHPVVVEPVAGDHREADHEGEELRPDGVAERAEVGPDPRILTDLERGDEQGEGKRVGGVDEPDRAIELRFVPPVPGRRGHGGVAPIRASDPIRCRASPASAFAYSGLRARTMAEPACSWTRWVSVISMSVSSASAR